MTLVHEVNGKGVARMPTTLRGLVYGKFQSIGEFANAIGWQRGKASRIINNVQEPTKSDIQDMIRVLEIPQTDIAPTFFGQMFTE